MVTRLDRSHDIIVVEDGCRNCHTWYLLLHQATEATVAVLVTTKFLIITTDAAVRRNFYWRCLSNKLFFGAIAQGNWSNIILLRRNFLAVGLWHVVIILHRV